MKTQIEPRLISSKRFIELLGISQAAFFRLRAAGGIGPRSVKLGRSVRWDVEEVQSWIEAKCPNSRHWESR